LAKAEEAMAKAASVRATASDEELAEEEERLEALRAAAGLDDSPEPEAKTDTAPSADGPAADEADEPEAVEVGGFSFPRRGGGDSTLSGDPTPDVDTSAADTSAPERKKPAKGRRKDDPVPSATSDAAETTDATAGETVEGTEAAPLADLESFGFSRRESKRSPKGGKHDRRKSDGAKKSTSADAVEDVAVVAEKSRSQWGSFQKGKQDAEAVATDSKKEQ